MPCNTTRLPFATSSGDSFVLFWRATFLFHRGACVGMHHGRVRVHGDLASVLRAAVASRKRKLEFQCQFEYEGLGRPETGQDSVTTCSVNIHIRIRLTLSAEGHALYSYPYPPIQLVYSYLRDEIWPCIRTSKVWFDCTRGELVHSGINLWLIIQ